MVTRKILHMMDVDVSLGIWKRKHGLDPENYHCPKCENIFSASIPFLTKKDAGLHSPIHDCGPAYIMYIATPRTIEGIAFYNSIV